MAMFNYFQCTVECTSESLNYYKEVVEKTKDKDSKHIYIDLEDFISGLGLNPDEYSVRRAIIDDVKFDDEKNLMTVNLSAACIAFQFFDDAFNAKGNPCYWWYANECLNYGFGTNDINMKYYKNRYALTLIAEDEEMYDEFFSTQEEVIDKVTEVFPNENIKSLNDFERINKKIKKEDDYNCLTYIKAKLHY